MLHGTRNPSKTIYWLSVQLHGTLLKIFVQIMKNPQAKQMYVYMKYQNKPISLNLQDIKTKQYNNNMSKISVVGLVCNSSFWSLPVRHKFSIFIIYLSIVNSNSSNFWILRSAIQQYET